MSREIIVNVYQYAELSEKAKEKARDWYRSGDEYHWADDELASLKAFAEHFGAKLAKYEIDWGNGTYSSASFDVPETEMEPAELEKLFSELGTFDPVTLKGNGDCVLTGYCGDENAIDGARMAWSKGERDLEKILQAGFRTWLKAAQADYEYQLSDEATEESIIANEYEFTADGKIWSDK